MVLIKFLSVGNHVDSLSLSVVAEAGVDAVDVTVVGMGLFWSGLLLLSFLLLLEVIDLEFEMFCFVFELAAVDGVCGVSGLTCWLGDVILTWTAVALAPGVSVLAIVVFVVSGD